MQHTLENQISGQFCGNSLVECETSYLKPAKMVTNGSSPAVPTEKIDTRWLLAALFHVYLYRNMLH